jgi:hypothetical protein
VNDPEARPGSLSSAAHKAEAARTAYELGAHEYQAEAGTGL